jgi:GntR family transcriptional regulator
MKLDKEGPVPLHVQFERAALDKIRSGEWPAGSRIPTEIELSSEFDVSRVTVRTALQRMMANGVLRRVSPRKITVGALPVPGEVRFYAGARARLEALSPIMRTHLLGVERSPATPELAGALDVLIGETLYLIRRARSENGVPVSLCSSYIPVVRAYGLDRKDLCSRPLCETLQREYNHPLLRQTESINTAKPDLATSTILGVPPSFPLLALDYIGFTTNDVPLERSETVFRSDKIRVELDGIRTLIP